MENNWFYQIHLLKINMTVQKITKHFLSKKNFLMNLLMKG